jgi:hypothetical protein
MIDRGAFASGISVLASIYGRELDGAALAAYFSILSDSLTTEEFERAVGEVLRREQFFPSPAVLLRAARPVIEGHAAFPALVKDIHDHGGFRFCGPEFYWSLPEPVRRGVQAIGGFSAISLCEERDWAALERRFVAAYNEAVASHRPSLICPSTQRPAFGAGENIQEVRQPGGAIAAALGETDSAKPTRLQHNARTVETD